MKIKAVIFDMDGVLIDAKEWHYEALNKALALFGYTIHRDEHLSTYDGLPTRTKLQKLTQEKGLPTCLHEFIDEIKQLYTMNVIHARCRPSFIHEYALSKLKNQGYKIAVASNSVRDSVHTMMRLARLDEYFDSILSNQDVHNPKPHPEIYINSMKKLNVAPHECIVVEDNENGIRAALASGAHLLRVETVHDVTYDNIVQKIKAVENMQPEGVAVSGNTVER